nr:nucleotidyltransferase domain-containing protein [Aneurinibacillus sp. XH2]
MINNELALRYAQEFSRLIVENYEVKKIVLFGSRVKGTYRPDSDIDVLIITYDYDTWAELSREVFKLRERFHLLISPLVHMDDEHGRGFIDDIKDSSITLYENKTV